jgi:TetR/AcrR family transcriptional regulator, cholesterol catabolism regulator
MTSLPIGPKRGIIDAAVRLFSEQSYPGTSMRDIARAVDLLPGSLYAHIEDKESLLGEIVEAGIDRFVAAAEPIAAMPAPADLRLRRMIVAHVGVIAEDVQLTRVVFHQWKYLGEPRRQLVVDRRRGYEAVFARVVGAGLESGVFRPSVRPDAAVLTILGMLNWAPEWLAAARIENAGERLADVVLNGLTA